MKRVLIIHILEFNFSRKNEKQKKNINWCSFFFNPCNLFGEEGYKTSKNTVLGWSAKMKLLLFVHCGILSLFYHKLLDFPYLVITKWLKSAVKKTRSPKILLTAKNIWGVFLCQKGDSYTHFYNARWRRKNIRGFFLWKRCQLYIFWNLIFPEKTKNKKRI